MCQVIQQDEFVQRVAKSKEAVRKLVNGQSIEGSMDVCIVGGTQSEPDGTPRPCTESAPSCSGTASAPPRGGG